MAGHGRRQTSSPTTPRTGLQSSSTTSTAHPSAGPPNEHGAMGSTTWGARKHPTSVPPLTLITGQRPPPTVWKYHHHGPSFHGSPVEPSTRNDERSYSRTG